MVWANFHLWNICFDVSLMDYNLSLSHNREGNALAPLYQCEWVIPFPCCCRPYYRRRKIDELVMRALSSLNSNHTGAIYLASPISTRTLYFLIRAYGMACRKGLETLLGQHVLRKKADHYLSFISCTSCPTSLWSCNDICHKCIKGGLECDIWIALETGLSGARLVVRS